VFVRVRVGPALALGLLAGAPLFAQSPGNVSSPKVAATVKKPVGLPVPEKYAKQFGTGATGARAALNRLVNSNSSREQITEALDAVTYYGHEGARALFTFTGRQLRRNNVEKAGDTSWYLPAVEAMARVPDTVNAEVLLHFARYGGDPALRARALEALGVLVANARYSAPMGRDGSIVRFSGVTADQGWHSLGESITREQQDAIKKMAERVKAEKGVPQTVRQEAERVLWWVSMREQQEQRAQTMSASPQNGAYAPGTGGGGFGTPPATE